jgi:polar amino acid transport system substrate-binding protein
MRLICIDAPCPPLFSQSEGGVRRGYEPAAAELVLGKLGRRPEWVFRPWAEMIPALDAGEGDAIWCGQAVTPARLERVLFTCPYGVFNESVVVRSGSAVHSAENLRGRRVGAISGSSNFALAETFDGAQLVAFDGTSKDVLGEMIAALRAGTVDAVVDDDVVLVPLAQERDLEIAFTVATRNAWAVAVSRARDDIRQELDGAIASVVEDGTLEHVWQEWMPELPYPL